MNVVVKRVKMQGFIVSDFDKKDFLAAKEDLSKWVTSGKLKTTEVQRTPQYLGACLIINIP